MLADPLQFQQENPFDQSEFYLSVTEALGLRLIPIIVAFGEQTAYYRVVAIEVGTFWCIRTDSDFKGDFGTSTPSPLFS